MTQLRSRVTGFSTCRLNMAGGILLSCHAVILRYSRSGAQRRKRLILGSDTKAITRKKRLKVNCTAKLIARWCFLGGYRLNACFFRCMTALTSCRGFVITTTHCLFNWTRRPLQSWMHNAKSIPIERLTFHQEVSPLYRFAHDWVETFFLEQWLGQSF